MVGIVAIAGGLFGLLGAIPVLIGPLNLLETGLASAVVIFSLLAFFIGTGLLRGIGWAWTVATAFYAVSIPLGITEAVAGGSTGLVGGSIRTIIGVVFLYYLLRPNVKLFFGKGSATQSS